MPIRQGHHVTHPTSGVTSPFISADLNDYSPDYSINVYDPGVATSPLTRYATFPVSMFGAVRSGYTLRHMGDDFYDRIYLTPLLFNLGTIVSPQVRTVELWNAHRYKTANLTDIVVDGTPVTIDGMLLPPVGLRPLQYTTYDITVGSTGAASVYAELLFDFSNVDDPPVVVIIGTRAVRFGVVPEVPVRETWQWLSDVFVSVDGTEQRAQVRIAPRTTNAFAAVFVSRDEINEFYAQLMTAQGRLWIPEYQYATRTTAESSIGSSLVYFDDFRTDIRAGEYVLIQTPTDAFLAEVTTVSSGSATLVSPLVQPVPVGSLIVPGSTAVMEDGIALQRYSVDEAATVDLTGHMQRQRDSLMRPGAVEVIPSFLGSKVLQWRPLANDLVPDAVFTGQEFMDNEAGMLDAVSYWDYSRIGGTRQFKVDRVRDPSQMDYWREFFDYTRGQARMFWMSTYRTDLTVYSGFSPGASSMTLEGGDYFQKLYAIPTHRYLEFTTDAGVHYAKVTSAVDDAGNSGIFIDPAIPVGSGWEVLHRVSYLLPLRLSSDDIEWEHHGLESILSMSIRTAEAQES